LWGRCAAGPEALALPALPRQCVFGGDWSVEGIFLFQFGAEGFFQGDGAGALEVAVDFFEAVDEVEDLAAGMGAAGGLAEVGAAAEGAGFVDEAAGGAGIEQGTGSVVADGEGFAAGGAEGFGGDEGFAAREVGDFAGELELATPGAEGALALEGAGCEVGVDFFHRGGGVGFQAGEGVGGGHGIRVCGRGAFCGRGGGFRREGRRR
jgi:hypothetical protein